MHRIAIESVRQELHPRGLRQPWFGGLRLLALSCRGLELCSRRFLLGRGMARAVRRRASDHSPWRAGGNFNCRDFWTVIAPGARWAAPRAILQNGPSYKLRDDGIVPLICPTCQNVFMGKVPRQRPMLLCMGLFSIFWLGAGRLAEP
jgi:hypothetical protein